MKLGIPALLITMDRSRNRIDRTAGDPEVGRKLGRPATCVQAKRMRLGFLPLFSVGQPQSLHCSAVTRTRTCRGCWTIERRSDINERKLNPRLLLTNGRPAGVYYPPLRRLMPLLRRWPGRRRHRPAAAPLVADASGLHT